MIGGRGGGVALCAASRKHFVRLIEDSPLSLNHTDSINSSHSLKSICFVTVLSVVVAGALFLLIMSDELKSKFKGRIIPEIMSNVYKFMTQERQTIKPLIFHCRRLVKELLQQLVYQSEL
ncbi:hypothetical protein J6590_059104 [Homalodisca vitripennis]|nr:hypothetical protein J6590_059104 [Homalodisca vitripennis]